MYKNLEIKGEIIKERYRDNKFSMASFKLEEYPRFATTFEGRNLYKDLVIVIAGTNLPSKGYKAVLKGSFIEPTDRNYQGPFEVNKIIQVSEYPNPKPFLMEIKGIGDKISDNIIADLGYSVWEDLKNNPKLFNNYKKYKRFTPEVINLMNKIAEVKPETIEKLEDLGLNSFQIAELTKLYLNESYTKIIKEPYELVYLNYFSFTFLDTIALENGFKKTDTIRIKTAINYILQNSLKARGDTYIREDIIVRKVQKLLDIPVKLIKEQVATKTKDTIYWRHKNKYDNYFLGLNSKLKKERFIARDLINRKNRYRLNPAIDDIIERIEAENNFKMHPLQIQAVKAAVNNGVFILTGGPGTGKTFTTKTIIDVLESLNETTRITCLAPTGRASRRMTEQTGKSASTIHSALKMLPNQKHSDVVLRTDIVIVDEASMLDIDLTYALLNSLENSTRIIFIGDVNQLESVGVGNVLYDLIESNTLPVVRLDKVFRQSEQSSININANKILKGRKDLIYDKDFVFLKAKNNIEAQRIALIEIDKAIRTTGLAGSTLLSPLRNKGFTAVNTINPLAQSLYNPQNKNKPELKLEDDRVFRFGDKVMMTQNTDYASNGDLGVITYVDDKPTVVVDFGYTKPAVLSNYADIGLLDLAYISTVHKSQGSEYDITIFLITNESPHMLQKSLFYTAITRAREKVILIGQKEAIDKAIDNVSKRRKTLLTQFLEVFNKN